MRNEKLLKDLTRLPRFPVVVGGFILIPVLGVVDYLTGYELSLGLFYLIPIFALSWVGGEWSGLAGAALCAVARTGADLLAGYHYSNLAYPIWNTIGRIGFFCIVAWLFHALRSSSDRQEALARTDYLTKAVNGRAFFDILRLELDRSRRHERPFTLVYFDLDNFKSINDSLGHNTGDRVLQKTVSAVKSQVRITDTVARLGGDEFALLFPETNRAAAETVVTKIRDRVLEEMSHEGWPVTVSIGVLTCSDSKCFDPDLEMNQLVKQVDDLMYVSKQKGKNTISFS